MKDNYSSTPYIDNEYNQQNYPQNNQLQNRPLSNDIQMFDKPLSNHPPQIISPNNYNQIPQNYGMLNQYPLQPYPQNINNNIIAGVGTPLLINQNNNNSLEFIECLEDLKDASKAILIKSFEVGLLCCFVDTIYEILMYYKDGFKRQFFIGKKKMVDNCCGDGKSFKINVKYVPRDSNYSILSKDKDYNKRLFDIISDRKLGFFTPEVQISNAENGTIFGYIKQPQTCKCCCSDPDFQIVNSMNLTKYRITTDGCQCSYCCLRGCCCLDYPISYRILDSTRTENIGEIFKNDYTRGKKEKLTYRITFPTDASPEEKILIISSAIAIDNYVYIKNGRN